MTLLSVVYITYLPVSSSSTIDIIGGHTVLVGQGLVVVSTLEVLPVGAVVGTTIEGDIEPTKMDKIHNYKSKLILDDSLYVCNVCMYV